MKCLFTAPPFAPCQFRSLGLHAVHVPNPPGRGGWFHPRLVVVSPQIGSFPPRGQIKNALKTPREPPVAGDASHPLYNYCIDELGYLRQVRVKQTVTLSCLTNIV